MTRIEYWCCPDSVSLCTSILDGFICCRVIGWILPHRFYNVRNVFVLMEHWVLRFSSLSGGGGCTASWIRGRRGGSCRGFYLHHSGWVGLSKVEKRPDSHVPNLTLYFDIKGDYFFLSFTKEALLIYNSHAIQLILLNCLIKCFLVYSKFYSHLL